MSDRFCTFRGDREAALVAYLYNDIEPAERLAFEAHVAICDLCTTELAGLGVVRSRLEQWAPPEPARTLAAQVFAPADPVIEASQTAHPRWYDVPVWMQAVAAVLILGVAAGAANLQVTYNHDGFSVRTGWFDAPAAVTTAPEPPTAVAKVEADAASRAELAALGAALRAEIAAASANPAEVRQVRTLLADSERKQENELALRMAALYRDVQNQRAADMVKMERGLDSLSNSTGLAVQQIRTQVPEYFNRQVRLLQKQ